MTSTPTFHLVRHGSAAKLGANSAGSIHYAVLIDADRTEPFIALTGNDGGGYFSREAVPISALRRCAQEAGFGQTLKVRMFKPAFVGRSTNNSYFAVAALCAEGLLNRMQHEGPGRGQSLADAGFWDDWCSAVRAQAAARGDGLPVFPIGKPATDTPSPDDAAEAAGEQEAEAPGLSTAAFAEVGTSAPAEQADDTATAQADAAIPPRRRAKART